MSDILVEKDRIILPLEDGQTLEIPLDGNGEMDLKGRKAATGQPTKAKPFTDERVWHMGIVLAAQELNLDLDHAEVDLPHRRITLRGANNIERVIPVDADGYFYVDWRLTKDDPHLARAPIESLLLQDHQRCSARQMNYAMTFAANS